MGTLLLAFTYIVVVAAALTGLLKLAVADNQVLKVLHRSCGPLANFLFTIYFILFQFLPSGQNQRVLITAAFLLLVYTGLVTAKSEPTRRGKILHIALGSLALVLFSFLFFTFVLMLTGIVPAPGGVD